MKRWTSFILLVAPLLAGATDNPYAGQEQRAIKALSEQEISDYLNGRGMGVSKAAELNHYPGPRHVLDLAPQIGLSKEQIAKAQALYDSMARDAARLGQRIVQKEAELEALYATQKADADNTRGIVRELAALQAEFRLAHLNAHLSMRQILSPQQIAAYDSARGYDGTNAHRGGHQHH
jgi:Spy/CpxP family protein refolding chaperone